MKPLLSILTPACWERIDQVRRLQIEIKNQIREHNVEHLVLLDNRTRSVGLKRQALVKAALGDYIAFVDDDDGIAEDYVDQLRKAITEHQPDVITFDQHARHNEVERVVSFGLKHRDEDFFHPPGDVVKRNVWQVCAIRREIAIRGVFPDIMDGEDIAWSQQVRPFIRTRHHIPQILHTYRFNATTTLASGKQKPGD